MIVQGLVDMQENLPVMTLDPNLEQLLHNSLQQAGQEKGPVLEPV